MAVPQKMERPAKSAARCRKENAAMARREAPVLSRGSAATKNNGCATWRAIPLVCRGVEKREERRAYPGPRQRIRVMTLGLMMGCLKSESGKWGRAGVQRTRRHGRIDAQRHGRIYSGHPLLLAVPSTSCLLRCREDVDARHEAGHDG